MSSEAETEQKKNSSRRRTAGKSRDKQNKDGEQDGEKKSSQRRRKDKVVYGPLPKDDLNKELVGRVAVVIRNAVAKSFYGFITVGEAAPESANTPSVYFDQRDVPEEYGRLRPGYIVTFTAKSFEGDKIKAVDMKLTDKGKEIQTEREAYLAEQKAKEADKPADPVPKADVPKKASSKQRKKKEINLKATCEGDPETKELTFDILLSVGRLKRKLYYLFKKDGYSIYKDGEFLTGKVLKSLQEGDTINYAPEKK